MAQWLTEALLTLRKEPDLSRLHREKKSSQPGLFLALMIVVPLVTVLSTHLWLRSAYTSHVFHLQGFLDQYSSGIYRYRIFGRKVLLSTFNLLSRHHHDQPFPMPTDADATLLFYGAYVLLNALFFFLGNLLLLLFLWDRQKGISDLRLALYFFFVLFLALSTYTVTPYDQLAYFLMLVGFISVRIQSSLLMYLVLGIAAVAGGLNRETQFLVTPAFLTVALFSEPGNGKLYLRAGLYHLFLFTVCYVGLRISLPGAPAVAEAVTLGGKWALPSLLILSAVFYVGVVLAAREYRNRKPAIALLILSAPYILTILISGELRELRLLIPLLLCLVFVYIQLAQDKKRSSTFISPA